MLAPSRDITGFTSADAGLIHPEATLPLERPLPYAFAADPVWLRPTLAPWLAARANLERLSRDGRRIILLAAERSLDAPDAPDAQRLFEHGVIFALSLAGLEGRLGAPVQARARALLASPGVHLLVSLAPDAPAQSAAWAAFDPEIHGIARERCILLTETNWGRLASGEPPIPVSTIPPQAGFFRRVMGRDKARPAPAAGKS